MRRSVLCVLVALVLCFTFLPGQALAQTGIKIETEDMVITRTNYPSVKPAEGSVRIYAGEWSLSFEAHNYDVRDGYYRGYHADSVKARVFLDNVLLNERSFRSYAGGFEWIDGIYVGHSSTGGQTLSISELGEHEVRIEVWHGDETQPQDTYGFNVLVVKPEVSGLQARSRVVRAIGENSLGVSFTNGGNENMRQAVLAVADSGGLAIEPGEVELGDVNPGEQVSASFAVSSPASVTLGTTQIRFSLSFIDYAGVPHEEDIYGEVEVYRLSPTLTLLLPDSVENGSNVEILAVLKDPDGNPVAGENITLTIGGVELGTFKTDSNGAARASYRATETGAFDVGASFPGSASYSASSASADLTVTPAVFPLWIILLAVIIVASVVGLAAYLKRRGPRRRAARHIGGLPYRTMCLTVISGMAVMTFCYAGLMGLLILATATAVGILPAVAKVKRTHCMEVIMLPCILYFAGAKDGVLAALGL